jgi:polyketide cyclase/dehydrase/lipid transport protein
MRLSTTFEVPVPRDRVFAFLSNPRNLIAANHTGPVVDQSEGALGPGSWFVLAFNQLRMRVEYVVWEPTSRIAVAMVMTGRGSGGLAARQQFVLTQLNGGERTQIGATVEGTGGFIQWEPLMRAAQSMAWRRLRKKLEASA